MSSLEVLAIEIPPLPVHEKWFLKFVIFLKRVETKYLAGHLFNTGVILKDVHLSKNQNLLL